MKLLSNYYLFLIISLLPVNLVAQDIVYKALNNYTWEKRQIILFSPNNSHAKYKQFKQSLLKNQHEVDDRNLHIWRIFPQQLVTLDFQLQKQLTAKMFYDHFNVDPNTFVIILLGYDGEIKLRQSETDLNLIFDLIDSMPIRVQEMNTT